MPILGWLARFLCLTEEEADPNLLFQLAEDPDPSSRTGPLLSLCSKDMGTAWSWALKSGTACVCVCVCVCVCIYIYVCVINYVCEKLFFGLLPLDLPGRSVHFRQNRKTNVEGTFYLFQKGTSVQSFHCSVPRRYAEEDKFAPTLCRLWGLRFLYAGCARIQRVGLTIVGDPAHGVNSGCLIASPLRSRAQLPGDLRWHRRCNSCEILF